MFVNCREAHTPSRAVHDALAAKPQRKAARRLDLIPAALEVLRGVVAEPSIEGRSLRALLRCHVGGMRARECFPTRRLSLSEPQ
jgi:hypothetical protein